MGGLWVGGNRVGVRIQTSPMAGCAPELGTPLRPRERGWPEGLVRAVGVGPGESPPGNCPEKWCAPRGWGPPQFPSWMSSCLRDTWASFL